MAEEALRRRDLYIINRKKTLKKAVISVSLVLVFAVFGGGAYVGISRLSSPDTPPPLHTEGTAPALPDTAEPADTTSPPETQTETVEDSRDSADSVDSIDSGEPDEPAEIPEESGTDAPGALEPSEDTSADTWTDVWTDTWVDTWVDVSTEPQESDPASDTENSTDTEPQESTTPQATETAPPTDEPADTAPPEDTESDTSADIPGIPPTSIEPGTNTAPPPGVSWEIVDHKGVGIPVTWGKVPEVLDPGPSWSDMPGVGTTATEIKMPESLYYTTELDLPEWMHLTSGDTPTVIPKYKEDGENVPDAKAQTDKFLTLLYGDVLPFMGQYVHVKDDVVFSTWDDAIVETNNGKYIAADRSYDMIYFTIDLSNPETVGDCYRDMTHEEAFALLEKSKYYKAAIELLELTDPMVSTEIHRYYSGNLYEYCFTVTEYADNLADGMYNYASANVKIEMRYYPEYGVIRAYFEVSYKMPLVLSGETEFISYAEQMESLSAAFKKQGYSAAYANYTSMSFCFRKNTCEYYPIMRYYLGYSDGNGELKYAQIYVRNKKD